MKKHHFSVIALIAILLIFSQCKKTNQLEVIAAIKKTEPP